MTDLIDRQAAIRWVKTECNPYGKPTLDYETGIKVMNHLNDMPSAEPEWKRGRWMWVDGVRCSQCNYKLETTGLPSYCPNCGARMD